MGFWEFVHAGIVCVPRILGEHLHCNCTSAWVGVCLNASAPQPGWLQPRARRLSATNTLCAHDLIDGLFLQISKHTHANMSRLRTHARTHARVRVHTHTRHWPATVLPKPSIPRERPRTRCYWPI